MTPAVLVLAGPVTREGVTGLCEDVHALLVTGTGGGGGGRDPVVVCDVAGLGPPGLDTVELLARVQLTARRAGGRIRLRDPAPALLAFLDLVGLRFDVEGEREGKAEQREPALGVEEAVEPGDPAL
ncbi:STAS domain-containing protein [Streptomyces sp. SID12488]|nr:STAS domain-containing protein [Streptomyces sp. SID12488]